MNRRVAVKKIVIASGSLITLPFWMTGCDRRDKTVHHSTFTNQEQETLAHIVDTFIPAGNAIGALKVGVDIFLQKVIDDCYEKEIRDNVKGQLKLVESNAKEAYKQSFGACDQSQREKLLIRFSTSAIKLEKDFFALMKSETIRGFNTSREVMQDYLHYQVAPGHYYGCVAIKT